jgi:uncharacterized membrane protein (Fun14 family)
MKSQTSKSNTIFETTPLLGASAKLGAWLFVLWGVLHLWVGYEGIHQYLSDGTAGLWNTVIGGSAVPRAAFVHASDESTLFAQGQLLLNFCLDVGGYGVLGLAVAWLILKRASWAAYFIGVFVIGIADLSFLFSMVTTGVIELNAGTVGGPIIWIIAVIATPFGMPPLPDSDQNKTEEEEKSSVAEHSNSSIYGE